MSDCESDEFTHCIGFGYADSRKEFKVVRLFSGNDFGEGKRRNCCEVFTLGTSGWRKSKCLPPEYRTTYWNYNAPFVHSAIHFLPEKHIGDASLNGIDVFNLETEEFTMIPLPEYYNTVEENPAFRFMNLQELGGSLSLIFHFRTVVELWTLRDCTTGMWMKAHTIDLMSVSSALVVGGPLPGDGSILLNAFPETDLLYNCNSRETKIIQRAEENSDMLNVFFVESFASLGTRE